MNPLCLSFRRCGLLFCLAWVADTLAPTAAQVLPQPRVTCRITASRTELSAGSPLLVRLTLHNEADDALVLRQPLDDLYGTASVLVRRPGAEIDEAIRTRYTGLRQALNFRSTLHPRETMASYHLLLCDARGRFVFETAGRYELRGRLSVAGSQFLTEPLLIKVNARDASGQQAIEALKDDLTHLSVNEALDAPRLARLRTGLGSVGGFEEAMLLASGLAALGPKPDDAVSRHQGLEALMESEDALWSEFAKSALAYWHAERGDLSIATHLLKGAPHRSKMADDARKLIEERKVRP